MARQPVQSIPLSAQLTPQAKPIDTYVRPSGRNSLHDLADALGTMNNALQNFASIRDQKQQLDDALRGRAAFLTDHEGAFAQAVTEGKIPAQYSPSYVKGFKEAQGAASGESLRTLWGDAWDNWDGKNSEDPKAFDSFFSGFVKDNLKTQDPDVLRGILPSIDALHQNAYTQFVQYRHQKTVDGSLDAHGAVISNTVQSGIDVGITDPKGANYSGIFDSVNKVVAESLSKGDPGGKAVDTFMTTMSQKIIEAGDPKLLEWFDTKVPGQSYTYGETPKGLIIKNQTVDSLETAARQQAAGMSAAERQRMDKLKDEAQSSIIKGFVDNPDQPPSEELLAQAEKNGDPLIRVHAREWRDALTKGSSDPNKMAAFYNDVITGAQSPKQALLNALSHGVFGTAEDMRAATAFVQSFEGSQDTISKALGGQAVKSLEDAIKYRLTAKDELFNPLVGMSDAAFEAVTDLRQLTTRWIISNPNATQTEIEEQVNKFGKTILDRMSTDEFGLDERTYSRDPSLPFSNPYADGKPSSPPSVGKSGQQGSSASNSLSKDKKVIQWEQDNNLTEEQRTTIQGLADRLGMSYDEFVHQRALRDTPADLGGLLQKMAYDPNSPDHGASGEQNDFGISRDKAKEFIDKAFLDGGSEGGSIDKPQALLGLIREHEAAGNYSAVYGNAGNTDDLSQYTVDDILGMQQYARLQGAKSTAIGGYQFIYRTLKGLKAQMGLSGLEAFTPELQDRMAMTLLNNRGLQAFKDGRMSKEAFALSLSQEWASLPDPTTGQSFYAGDGLNRSLTPPSRVYAALGFGSEPTAQQANYSPDKMVAPPNADVYANIPDTDGNSNTGQKQKFLEWNSDPVANNEANLASVHPDLASVFRKAREKLPFKIVIGSGKRDQKQQENAVKWGWSKTLESDHEDGSAADIWSLDTNGAVTFDKAQQKAVVKAMKQAAKELGVTLDVGADWKSFKDMPHFAIKGGSKTTKA